jgi:hypothetical protein
VGTDCPAKFRDGSGDTEGVTTLGGTRRDASRRGGDTGAAVGNAPRCRAGAGNVRKSKRWCLAVQARRRGNARWRASAEWSSVRRLLSFSKAVQRNRRDCFSLERRGFFRDGGCGTLSSLRICDAIVWAIDTIQQRLGKTNNEV